MQWIRTMEYYTTIKRKALLIHTTTWMDLKNNMLSLVFSMDII